MSNRDTEATRQRIAQSLAEAAASKPVSVHDICTIADILDVPVERILIGAGE
jgi:hypothetical protein